MGQAGGDDEDVVALAVDELYRRYAGPLFVFANRTVRDPELAREIVNDTMLRAWRHADRFDPKRASMATWLFAIARNLAIDSQRRRGARPDVVADLTDMDLGDSADIDRALEAWQIADAVQTLTAAHREAIVEVHLRGASIHEAAAHLGVPPGTVKSRLHYGLRALRLVLEERGVIG